MTDYHLNMGHYFSRPYESDYSIVRRFLVVNPKISLNEARYVLLTQNPEHRYLVDCLRAQRLPVKEDVYDINFHKIKTYLRQCPECAKALYHSDVYALPWLTKCPIHDCELTEECPICHMPWPSIKEIEHRDCAVCGRPELDEIKLSDPCNTGSYKPIGELLKVLNASIKRRSTVIADHLGWDIGDMGWWKMVTHVQKEFPQFYMDLFNQATNSVRQTLSKNIKYARKKVTKLTEKTTYFGVYYTNFTRNYMYSERFREFFRERHGDWRRRRMQVDYQIMKRVVSWIDGHAPKSHTLHLTDYRALTNNLPYKI